MNRLKNLEINWNYDRFRSFPPSQNFVLLFFFLLKFSILIEIYFCKVNLKNTNYKHPNNK